MKHLLIVALTCCLAFTACHKHDQTQLPDYVPGRVLIGITPGTPIQSVFGLANSAGLTIASVSDYKYAAPYPKDSLNSLKNLLLNNKPYINKPTTDTTYRGITLGEGGIAAVFYDSTAKDISVECTLLNMDITAQTDWLSTMQQLQLTDKTITTIWLYVKVPPGQEQQVIDMVKTNPIVAYAQLNHFYKAIL